MNEYEELVRSLVTNVSRGGYRQPRSAIKRSSPNTHWLTWTYPGRRRPHVSKHGSTMTRPAPRQGVTDDKCQPSDDSGTGPEAATGRGRADRGGDPRDRPNRCLRADPARQLAHPDSAAGQADPGAERALARSGGRIAVKHGSVSQRHMRSCPRAEDGSYAPHRCRGTWQWVLEYGRDSNGRRLQTSKAGFPTKAAAQTALQQVVRSLMTDVNITSMTVGEYLEAWLTGKHALKPKTMSLYATSPPTTWCPIWARSGFSSCARIIWTGCTPASP